MKTTNKIFVLIITFFTTTLWAAEYKVDEIRVYKLQHRMDMMFEGKVTKTYTVMLGRGGMNPKRQEGDKLVPEGEYILDYKNPYSNFYRSIHISYPNAADIKRAEAMGLNPGFDIMVHGMPKWLELLDPILDERAKDILFKKGDWTAGCVAVQNNEIMEIWNNVEVPIKITIYHQI
ncbi:MAG: L,D-transpeptidase family protein [Bacteriovorax sp.]|nr:L,D-transpeptidase family protein [Bacteriovorax sp.]